MAASVVPTAMCLRLGGRRSGDPNHIRAADVLQEIGATLTAHQGGGAAAARPDAAEESRYEDMLVAAKDADDAAEGCERLVIYEGAGRVKSSAHLLGYSVPRHQGAVCASHLFERVSW